MYGKIQMRVGRHHTRAWPASADPGARSRMPAFMPLVRAVVLLLAAVPGGRGAMVSRTAAMSARKLSGVGVEGRGRTTIKSISQPAMRRTDQPGPVEDRAIHRQWQRRCARLSTSSGTRALESDGISKEAEIPSSTAAVRMCQIWIRAESSLARPTATREGDLDHLGQPR